MKSYDSAAIAARAHEVADKYSDSYADDLVDAAQSGFYETTGNILTGARNLLTDTKKPWNIEQSQYDAAKRNLDEIDPYRRSNMDQWGFEKYDDINASNTGMQIARVGGSFLPSMVPGGIAGKALQAGAQAVGLGTKAQKIAQAGGYAASGAPLIGGAASHEVGQTLRNMSPGQLSRLEGFEQYNSPEEFIYAQEQSAVKQGAGIGAVSMGVAGPVMQRMALGLGTKSALNRIGTGAGVEGLQEGFEEGGQARIVNPLVGRPAWEGVGERAAEGFALGAGAGGTAGTVGAGINTLTGDLPMSGDGNGPLSRAAAKSFPDARNLNLIQPHQEKLMPEAVLPPQPDNWERYDKQVSQEAPEPRTGREATIAALQNHPDWEENPDGSWQKKDGTIKLNIKPEPELGPDVVVQPESGLEPDVGAQPEAGSEPEPEKPLPKHVPDDVWVQPEPEPGPGPEPVPQPSVGVQPEPEKPLVEPQPKPVPVPVPDVGIQPKPEPQVQANKEVDKILKSRGIENPLNQIIASKVEAMQQDGLNPQEYHSMLSGFADSYNAGILAAENNEISNTRSKEDPYYFSGASLIGKDNVRRSDEQEQPIQFPDNPDERIRVEQIPRGSFNSPVKKINSNHDAAALVKSAIGNDAQESMLAVVTDKNGEVLNVIRHTKGAKASSSVFAGDLVSSIVNTPGAKSVRWAHSHPSGVTSSSSADERITERLNKLLEGTGITPAGHVIVVPHQDSYYDLDSGKEESLVSSQGGPSHPMNLTERVIVRRDMDNPVVVNSPQSGRDAVNQMKAENGLVLMDTRNQVIGNLPLTQAEMLTLKSSDKPALNEIFKAIDRTNTSAILIKGNDKKAAANVSRFLNAHGDVRVLDYINSDGKSDAERGETVIKSTGKYFRKSSSTQPGQTVQNLRESLQKQGFRGINVEQSSAEGKNISGRYENGQVTLYADNISPADIQKVLLHEIGVHKELSQEKFFNDALAQVQKLSKTSAKVQNAYQQASQAGTSQERMNHEALAYLVEHEPTLGIVKRLIAKIKAWLVKNFGIGMKQLSQDDFHYLALQALKADTNEIQDTDPSSNAHSNALLSSAERLTDFLKNRTEDYRPKWLGALTLRQLADVGKEYLPQLQDYVDLNTQMQTERNAASEEYNKLAERWRKFAARNRSESEALSRLMHDSTLAGVDPSEDQSSKDLTRRWNKLSPEAKKLYADVRDSYILQNQRMADALQERIESSELDRKQKEALKLEIRQQFEQRKQEGVYFPLSRFGEYWLAGKDKSGEKVFSMYENHADLIKAEKQLKAQGYTGITTGRKLEQARLGDADENLMADLNTVLKNNGIDANNPMMDEIYQVFLRTMPDVSMRRSFIHRQGVKGYSPDALRGYASHSTHNASQTAQLRYSGKMKSLLDEMKDHTSSDPIKATALANEMQKRHEWVMNPTNSKIAQKSSAIGFAWFLGMNPASALVNLTQNALVTMPVLASNHGAIKSFTKMNTVLGEFLKAKGDFNSGLKGNRLRAFKSMQKTGAIDVTQAHNLAGLGDTDSLNEYSPKVHTAMKGISYLFHKAEVLNRAVSGMAAYDLAREKKIGHADAIRYAEEVIWESHFDYGNANRARFMQGDFAKVLLMFRQYSQNLTYYLMRNFYQTFKGESKEVRAEARKKLTGTLGVSALMSGGLGLPMVSTLAATVNAAASAFGDDDEPYDFNTELRSFLSDYLGKDGAKWVLDGAVNQLTGAAVSDRVKLNDLWLRAPSRDMEGRDSYHYYLEQIAGPMGSIPLNAMRGLQLVNDGHLQRGIETMLPVAVKNAAKALRYAQEGVNTIKGSNPLVDDVSAYEELIQALGFTPERVSSQYKINTSLKNYEKHILKRRSRLLASFAMARSNNLSTKSILGEMREFSKKYPGLRINGQTLRRSMKARARYRRDNIGGINLNKNLRFQLYDKVM